MSRPRVPVGKTREAPSPVTGDSCRCHATRACGAAPCPAGHPCPASGRVLQSPRVSRHATPNSYPSSRWHADHHTCSAPPSLQHHQPPSAPRPPDRDLLRSTHGLLPHLAAKLLLDAALLRALPALAYALPFYWIMGLRRQAAAFFTFLGAFVTMACLAGAPARRRGSGATRRGAVCGASHGCCL